MSRLGVNQGQLLNRGKVSNWKLVASSSNLVGIAGGALRTSNFCKTIRKFEEGDEGRQKKAVIPPAKPYNVGWGILDGVSCRLWVSIILSGVGVGGAEAWGSSTGGGHVGKDGSDYRFPILAWYDCTTVWQPMSRSAGWHWKTLKGLSESLLTEETIWRRVPVSLLCFWFFLIFDFFSFPSFSLLKALLKTPRLW